MKFGWSEYYQGGVVNGNFAWLVENGEKNGGRGHEAFNFMPMNGIYHCYVPPHAGRYAPTSEEPTGWTVICLAKHPKHPGVHIVGWYENATLHGEWLEPPANLVKKRGDTDHFAYDWSYCITSKTAYFVPPKFRNVPFSDDSVRRAKYMYLVGPAVKVDDTRRRVLELLEDRIRTLRPFAIVNPNEEEFADPELDAVDPLKGFGTAEQRKRVEQAAEKAVIAHYESRGFDCERVTHLPCGYDFIFSNGRKTLHVEVKGTSGNVPQFFLTSNEYAKGLQSDPHWHLAMVTSALNEPHVVIYDAAELQKIFDLDPYVYVGKFVPSVI